MEVPMANINLAIKQSNDVLPGPSAWELFLLGTGVPESRCASLLSGQTRTGRAIRAWVLDHYAKNYVPEYILEALGLRKQLIFRWQREE
jgi:hypothetical protein